MFGVAESGRLPIFFADWDLEPVETEMPQPPCGVDRLTDRDDQGKGLIANEDLVVPDLPKPNARGEGIE